MKNSFFRYLFLVAVLLSYTSVEAQQKAKDQSAEQQSHLLKPLDIAACMSWKRVESPDISPTGRWVTYRIAPMEYNSDDKESKILHLFDSRTRKEIVLPDVEQIQYYDADRAVYYEQADTAGNMKTILMSLPSGVKTEWTYKESFRPVEGVPYSVSVSNVPEDTVNHIPSFDCLVVRHLKTGTAFQIDSIGYYLFRMSIFIFLIRKEVVFQPNNLPFITDTTYPYLGRFCFRIEHTGESIPVRNNVLRTGIPIEIINIFKNDTYFF